MNRKQESTHGMEGSELIGVRFEAQRRPVLDETVFAVKQEPRAKSFKVRSYDT